MSVQTQQATTFLSKQHSGLQYLHIGQKFTLESGASLPELRIGYHTFGKLNKEKSNVIWVFHALTANADPTDWWKGLIGSGYLLNPEKYFIVCANVVGSCYGSTGPLDFNPVNGERYLRSFPLITIKDMVSAHQILRDHLNLEQVYLGIGGSMGGQQMLEWAVQEPNFFAHLVGIGTGARSSSWGIGIRSAQRMAIEADPSFFSSSPKGGWKGLEAARAMAMISYRSRIAYNKSQVDQPNQIDNYRAESYQRYQGAKLNQRFDARTYHTLSKAMDTQDIGRHRGGVAKALNLIASKALIIGIEGDLLFSKAEHREMAHGIANAQLAFINSDYGHDGFLVEAATISNLIKAFLNGAQLLPQ